MHQCTKRTAHVWCEIAEANFVAAVHPSETLASDELKIGAHVPVLDIDAVIQRYNIKFLWHHTIEMDERVLHISM